jgi:hypothetical protein
LDAAWEMTNAYKNLVWNQDSKRPRHRGDNNIKNRSYKEIRNGSVDWIHVAQDRNQRQVLANQRNFQLTGN